MTHVFDKNPENVEGFIYTILAVILLCLSWITVVARIAARYSIKSLGLDDCCVVLAQLAMTAFCSSAFGMRSCVTGRYPATLQLQKESVKWLIVSEASFSLGMLFLKISLGAFFLRLIHSQIHRNMIYGAMALSTVANLYICFFSIFACGMPNDSYVIRYLTNRCVPRPMMIGSAFAQCAINTLTDITFALVPFLLLRRSQLPRSVKVYVGAILVLATVGCVASIVRFWYIEKLFMISLDVFRQLSYLGIVGIIELGIGIVASSIPTLRPLFRSCIGYTATIYHRSSRKATQKTNESNVSGEVASKEQHRRQTTMNIDSESGRISNDDLYSLTDQEDHNLDDFRRAEIKAWTPH